MKKANLKEIDKITKIWEKEIRWKKYQENMGTQEKEVKWEKYWKKKTEKKAQSFEHYDWSKKMF